MTTGNRPRPLSDLIPGMTQNVFGRKNLLFGKLLGSWTDIAGADIAAVCMPLELKFARTPAARNKAAAGTPAKPQKTPGQAVLHLGVTPAHALELSYQKSLLIERLNMFFGYAAIKDIKFIQYSEIMDNKKKPAAALQRPVTLQEGAKIDQMVAGIQESDLQTALKNLGKAIISRSRTKH